MTKKKNKGARPEIVFTKEQTAKVEELSAYLNCEQIADYFGISHITFQEVRRRQEEVSFAYKRGKAKGIQEAAGLLWAKMKEGNTNAITFYLEHMMVKKVRISFDDNSPMGVFNSGLKALVEGKIDLTQMEQLANCALIKMKIENFMSVEEKSLYEHKEREVPWDRTKPYPIGVENWSNKKKNLKN